MNAALYMVDLPVLDIIVTGRQFLSMSVSFIRGYGNIMENENLAVGYIQLGE
jgi:hypothetical protein